MKQNILKFQLIILLFFSVISTFYFFLGTYLPDNSLMISSTTPDFYSIPYYISSFLAVISFYMGPWILVPFLFFAFVYTFILNNRSHISDIMVGLCMTGFFYTLTFLVSPSYLGKGLKILSESYLDLYVAFGTVIVLGLLMMYLTLRGTFFVILKKLQLTLERIGLLSIKKIQSVSANSKTQLLEYSSKIDTDSLKMKTAKIISEGGNIAKGLKPKLKTENIEAQDVEGITPIVKPNISNDNSELSPPSKYNSESLKCNQTKKHGTKFFKIT